MKEKTIDDLLIAVIGLGYVGLPLSLQFSRSGVSVLGFDLDQQKVDSINAGKTYLKHFPSEFLAQKVLRTSQLQFFVFLLVQDHKLF